MKPTLGLHTSRQLQTARAQFVTLRGAEAAAIRASEIADLHSKTWKGKTVYRITCAGGYGAGAHEVWVPESLLWSLLSLRVFHCAYHR